MEDFNWRDRGLLTPIRDQGHCNCCWAITAAGVLESIYNIKIRNKDQNLVQGAPQQLIDCLIINPCKIDSEGCYTSSITKAFKWIRDNGLAREKHYPFMAKKGVCKQIEERKLKIKSFVRIHDFDIDILNSMIQQHPIAGAIRITSELKRLENEIYYGPADPFTLLQKPEHAVLIVGFGKEDDGNKFWIIKNSWGERWRDNGYGKISQNKVNTSAGPRYLLARFSYPIIPKKKDA